MPLIVQISLVVLAVGFPLYLRSELRRFRKQQETDSQRISALEETLRDLVPELPE
jgi:hypothetical protein